MKAESGKAGSGALKGMARSLNAQGSAGDSEDDLKEGFCMVFFWPLK